MTVITFNEPNEINKLMHEIHASIGCLITTWSMAEYTLAFHVARLIAFDPSQPEINVNTFTKAAAVCSGTSFAALINQAVNMTTTNPEISNSIKSYGNDLVSRLKLKRDDLAHMFVTSKDGNEAILLRLSYGKTKWNVHKTWSVDEINKWSSEILHSMRQIDILITQFTGQKLPKELKL